MMDLLNLPQGVDNLVETRTRVPYESTELTKLFIR